MKDLYYDNQGRCFKSEYLPNKNEMMQWIDINEQNSGKKQQFVLGVKQFDYVKQLCLLAKESIPDNLEKLKIMYINKRKPMPYFKSSL